METININIAGMSKSTIHGLIVIRDRHRCQADTLIQVEPCWGRILEVHHKIPVKDDGEDVPSNLVTLCAMHHDVIHGIALGGSGKRMLRLKRIMMEAGIHQGELAGVLGMTQSAISQLVSRPPPFFLKALAVITYLEARTGKTYTYDELFTMVRLEKAPPRARKCRH